MNVFSLLLQCMLELAEMTGRQENSSGNYSLMLNSLEAKVKGLQEYTETKQVEAVDRLLELRKEFVEKHSDYLEMSSANKKEVEAMSGRLQSFKAEEFGRLAEEVTEVRTETGTRIAAIEKAADESSRKNSGRFVQIEGKLIGRNQISI